MCEQGGLRSSGHSVEMLLLCCQLQHVAGLPLPCSLARPRQQQHEQEGQRRLNLLQLLHVRLYAEGRQSATAGGHLSGYGTSKRCVANAPCQHLRRCQEQVEGSPSIHAWEAACAPAWMPADPFKKHRHTASIVSAADAESSAAGYMHLQPSDVVKLQCLTTTQHKK